MRQNETAFGGKAAPVFEAFTFDSILDETCERLLDRQFKYSIRRICDLEEILRGMEGELEEFLRAGGKQGAEQRPA
jgi:hypothetical protein